MPRWEDLVPAPSPTYRTSLEASLPDYRTIPSEDDLAMWSGDRRLAALSLHRAATDGTFVTFSLDTPYLRTLAAPVTTWTRDDLVWCLYTAAHGGQIIGPSGHLQLPALIAATLDPREWTDLRPAVDALFHEVVRDRDL